MRVINAFPTRGHAPDQPGHTTNEDLAFRKLRSELETSLSKLCGRMLAARLDPVGMITTRVIHRAAQLNPPVA
jgi:hypothetical protein